MCTKFLGDGLCCGYGCSPAPDAGAPTDMDCPQCGKQLIGVEYAYNDSDYYDGVSEWACFPCGYHLGRWSGKLLEEGEKEPKYGRARAPTD